MLFIHMVARTNGVGPLVAQTNGRVRFGFEIYLRVFKVADGVYLSPHPETKEMFTEGIIARRCFQRQTMVFERFDFPHSKRKTNLAI
jgi:hypothetical protein